MLYAARILQTSARHGRDGCQPPSVLDASRVVSRGCCWVTPLQFWAECVRKQFVFTFQVREALASADPLAAARPQRRRDYLSDGAGDMVKAKQSIRFIARKAKSLANLPTHSVAQELCTLLATIAAVLCKLIYGSFKTAFVADRVVFISSLASDLAESFIV